jgi:AraC-binding-like domain
MRSVRPLDRFPLIHTRNAEDMCAALERVYAKPKFYFEGGTKKIDATLNLYRMKNIGLGYTKYGIGMNLAYPESDVTIQTFPVCGKGEVTVNKIVSPLDPRHGITASPGMSFSVKLDADYEHFILMVNSQALAGKLAALTGASIHSPLQFHPIRDDAVPAAKALRNHFLSLVDAMSASDVPLPKLVLTEFEQTMLVMFLHANRHNYTHLLQRRPPDPAPWQVRRAEEYIEANARRAISLEELAEVTGVSALSLFRAFRQSRGYSPLQFAARLRAEHPRTQ